MSMQEDLEQLKYPIGKHCYTGPLLPAELEKCLADIQNLPEKLSKEIGHLSALQLDTPYRPGGWTLRQVAHHFADSHMNAFIRFKLALTEDNPTIKPYNESAWAAMTDSVHGSLSMALDLVSALHLRWNVLLRNIGIGDLQKSYFHPESGKKFTLEEAISLYAWHCNHHFAHITQLKKKNNWS